jgi:hypothetical protein
MDPTQTKIIELLREVHLIAFKEIERLNMRIVELEIQNRQSAEHPIIKRTAEESRPVHPAPIKSPSLPDAPELLNEHQVAKFFQLSVASVRCWRLFRTGPEYVKIGAAVRHGGRMSNVAQCLRCRAELMRRCRIGSLTDAKR